MRRVKGDRAVNMLVSVQPNLSAASDEVLVALARQRDEAAVRVLVRRYNRRLYRIARSVLGNDAEAEDAVQEAHINAFAALDRFRGDSSFATWITRIAVNAALARARRKRPTVPLDEPRMSARVIAFPSTEFNPEQTMAQSQVRVLLEQVVEELPAPFRTVFVMRDVEGMSVEETAQHLALKPATVKTRLHRARRMMREALAERAASTLPELFPFAGARCERMADHVIAVLRARGWGKAG